MNPFRTLPADLKPTEEQQAVLTAPTGSLLVSASAGTGKTHTLTHRIAEHVLSGALSLDRVLVMTFTEKAARQLREKIESILSEQLEALGETDQGGAAQASREAIQTQLAFLPRAQISTIHAFCRQTILQFLPQLRNEEDAPLYDPQVGMLDERSAALLLEQCVREELFSCFVRYPDGVIDEPSPELAKEAEAFYAAIDLLGGGGAGERLVHLIQSLYNHLRSLPNPLERLEKAVKGAEARGRGEDLLAIEILMRQLYEGLSSATDSLHRMQHLLQQGSTDRNLLFYKTYSKENLRKNQEKVEEFQRVIEGVDSLVRLSACCGRTPLNLEDASQFWNQLHKLLKRIQGITLPRKLADPEHPRNQLIADYTLIRGLLEPWKALVDDCSFEELLQREQGMLPALRGLAARIRAVDERYTQSKHKQNQMDFSDLEQECLRLLQREEIAKVLREQYQEIYIDEYQDTNEIQEEIINRIADQNVFYVGDVKQSIYRFRFAQPSLFIDRYKRYQQGDEGQLLQLNHNFRSSPEILASVNEVFRILLQPGMTEGIDYAADHLLAPKPGVQLEARPENPPVTLHLVADEYPIGGDPSASSSSPSSALKLDLPEGVHSIGEIELTRLVLIETLLSARTRVKGWEEIAILTQTNTASEELAAWIRSLGLPIQGKQKNRWFEDRAVRFVEALFRLLDNRLQDTPLLAVLLSPLAPEPICDEQDCLYLRLWADRQAGGRKNASPYFHEAYSAFLRAGSSPADPIEQTTSDESSVSSTDKPNLRGRKKPKADSAYEAELRLRLQKFEAWFSSLREVVAVRPLAQLFDLILLEGRLQSTLRADPDPMGRQSLEALASFRSFLTVFEQNGLRGLPAFLTYYDQYLLSPGNPREAHADPSGIQILTWHASKGLDYPIVLLDRLDRDTSKTGSTMPSAVVWDACLQLCYPWVHPRTRKTKTLPALEAHKFLESMREQEELIRVLYVALTRPKSELHLFARASALKLDWFAPPSSSTDSTPLLHAAEHLTHLKQARSHLERILRALNLSRREAGVGPQEADSPWSPEWLQMIGAVEKQDWSSWPRRATAPDEEKQGGEPLALVEQFFCPQHSEEKNLLSGFWRLCCHRPLLAHAALSPSTTDCPSFSSSTRLAAIQAWIQTLRQQAESLCTQKENEEGANTLAGAFVFDSALPSPTEREALLVEPRPSKTTVTELKRALEVREAEEAIEAGERGNSVLQTLPLLLRPLPLPHADPERKPKDCYEMGADLVKKGRSERLGRPLPSAGSEVGTALHEILYRMNWEPFLQVSRGQASEEGREAALEAAWKQAWRELVEEGSLDSDQLAIGERESSLLRAFFGGPLFEDLVCCIHSGGAYYRETPFTMTVGEGIEEGMVQGKIDLWYTGAEGITVVDYKSDRLKGDWACRHQELMHRYQIQLDYYAKALERASGQPVRRRVIWLLREAEAHEVSPQDPA